MPSGNVMEKVTYKTMMDKLKNFFEWLYYEHNLLFELIFIDVPLLIFFILIVWEIDGIIVNWWIKK